MKRLVAPIALGLLLCLANAPRPAAASTFKETDLVSDLPGRAALLDSNLVNPWGISISPSGRVRIADNGVGLSTAYSANGKSRAATIIIPPAGAGNPTGLIENRKKSAFKLSNGKHGAPTSLIFASEDGTISAWSPQVDPHAATTVATTPDGVYKGVTIASHKSESFLFATNFHAGTVDVFDSHFNPVFWSGAFSDPTLPDGYAPFGIANLQGNIYVSYALQDSAKHDDQHGAGFGFINVFDTRGHWLRRLVSNGPLNAPWGMVIAPKHFGALGHTLLVGNFGDGMINAFDPMSGALVGPVTDSTGTAISIPGLWGLAFGKRADVDRDDDEQPSEMSDDEGDDDGNAEDQVTWPLLFFTAGIEDEAHGLFGSLALADSQMADDDHHGDDDHHRHGHDHDNLHIQAGRTKPVRLSQAKDVEFTLTAVAPTIVRIRVFDVMGRVVAEPASNLPVSGTVVTRWDGVTLRGTRIKAGTYFVHASSENGIAQDKLVLLP